jgi:hypothetical protein
MQRRTNSLTSPSSSATPQTDLHAAHAHSVARILRSKQDLPLLMNGGGEIEFVFRYCIFTIHMV